MRSGAALLGLLLSLSVAIPAAPPAATATRAIDAGYSRQTAYLGPDPAIERLQDFFGPTLEANRKRFLGRLGIVSGFGAGTLYPQIWLRDSATLLPLSRYLHGREHLVSWLEEHFAHQKENGELYDWIAGGASSHFTEWAPRAVEVFRSPAATVSADKNTIEADQEASAVLALGRVFAATGDLVWLRKKIGGRTLLERADLALSYLFKGRLDPASGLITSGFSADWGDLSPVYPDQRAIYLDAQTPRVVGLYTNTLAYGAAQRLAALHRATGGLERAAFWEHRARGIRAGLRDRLWREGPGFYRMHHLLAAAPGPGWDDDGIFALGGNAVAALLGVADERQSGRIFAVAEARRRQFGVSTVAAALLPPYPSGFFKHPAMKEAFSYQNGGQWDWFAGRLVLAELERGHSVSARRHLRELAEKAVEAGGLYEWHTRGGEGRGSPRYAGSAGVLAAAVFEGLYGVYLEAEKLTLRVRLGEGDGAIHLYEPATDTFVAYRYDYDARARLMSLRYASNHPRPGRLELLLPPGRRPVRAVLDGKEAAFERIRLAEDAYVALPTTWGSHELKVTLGP